MPKTFTQQVLKVLNKMPKCVVYFNQRLGAAYFKCWLKYNLLFELPKHHGVMDRAVDSRSRGPGFESPSLLFTFFRLRIGVNIAGTAMRINYNIYLIYTYEMCKMNAKYNKIHHGRWQTLKKKKKKNLLFELKMDNLNFFTTISNNSLKYGQEIWMVERWIAQKCVFLIREFVLKLDMCFIQIQ